MTIQERINKSIIGRLAIFGDEESDLLYYCTAIEGNHLEIGCLWGGTAIFVALAKGMENVLGDVYTIDSMDTDFWINGDPAVGLEVPTLEKVYKNLDKFEVRDRVHVIRAKSAPLPIPGCWEFSSALIDGGHSYQACYQDWLNVKAHKPKYVLFHDYDSGHPGVQQAVDKVKESEREYELFEQAGTMVALRRKDA